jgi:hypothetical protein
MMAMGGGPHTPPELSDQVTSRSVRRMPASTEDAERETSADENCTRHLCPQSEDLVELMLASTDLNQSPKATGGLAQATELDSVTAASSSGSTASRDSTLPPGTTASMYAGNQTPISNTSTNDDEDERLAELLWCKSAVYLNPSLTAAPTAGMPGFLAIVRTKTEQGGWQHLISWIPEKLVEGTRDFDAFVLVELSSRAWKRSTPFPFEPKLTCLNLQRTSAMYWCTYRRRWSQPRTRLDQNRPVRMPSRTQSHPSTRSKSDRPL